MDSLNSVFQAFQTEGEHKSRDQQFMDKELGNYRLQFIPKECEVFDGYLPIEKSVDLEEAFRRTNSFEDAEVVAQAFQNSEGNQVPKPEMDLNVEQRNEGDVSQQSNSTKARPRSVRRNRRGPLTSQERCSKRNLRLSTRSDLSRGRVQKPKTNGTPDPGTFAPNRRLANQRRPQGPPNRSKSSLADIQNADTNCTPAAEKVDSRNTNHNPLQFNASLDSIRYPGCTPAAQKVSPRRNIPHSLQVNPSLIIKRNLRTNCPPTAKESAPTRPQVHPQHYPWVTSVQSVGNNEQYASEDVVPDRDQDSPQQDDPSPTGSGNETELGQFANLRTRAQYKNLRQCLKEKRVPIKPTRASKRGKLPKS